MHVVAFLRFLPLSIVVLVQAYLALQAYFRADSGDCLDGSCSSALRSYVRYQVDGLLEAVLHVVVWQRFLTFLPHVDGCLGAGTHSSTGVVPD